MNSSDEELMRRIRHDLIDSYVVVPERVRHEDYVRHPVPRDIVVSEVY